MVRGNLFSCQGGMCECSRVQANAQDKKLHYSLVNRDLAFAEKSDELVNYYLTTYGSEMLMKRTLFFIAILLSTCWSAIAQFQTLQLEPSDTLFSHASFNSMEVIDNRADTSLGFIQKGLTNKYTVLNFDTSMVSAFRCFFHTMVKDSAAEKNTLVICVRKFYVMGSVLLNLFGARISGSRQFRPRPCLQNP